MSRPSKDVEWVSASEIGSYLYCSRQFWLSKVQKIPPTGEGASRLQSGTRAHHSHGVTYDWQRRLRNAALFLLLLGAAAALILFGLR